MKTNAPRDRAASVRQEGTGEDRIATPPGRSALLAGATSVFGQLPPAHRRRVSLDELGHAILDKDDYFAIMAAMDRIDTYAATALKLSARIKREFLHVLREFPARGAAGRRHRVPGRAAFVNAHFVLTCWSAVRVAVTIIQRFANRLALAAVKPAIRPFASDLKHYTDGRDHLEHLDERMPGAPKEAAMNPRVYGGLYNGEIFQFANGQWDISAKGSQRLRRLASELREALIADLLDFGARRNPDDVKRYLHRLAREVQTQQLTRRLTRLLAKAGIG